MVGQPPQPRACAAYLGAARIHYEWNDLEAAQQTGTLGVQLARQIEGIDTPVSGAVFLAKVMLAQGDEASAIEALSELAREAEQRGFSVQQPRIAAFQAQILLRQSNFDSAAAQIAPYELPLSQARLHMAQGNPADALTIVNTYLEQVTVQDWQDERLRTLVLQSMIYHQSEEKVEAFAALQHALSLAAPSRFVRIFLDEGAMMRDLLAQAAVRGIMPDYTRRLLTAFERGSTQIASTAAQPIIEPLSERELEILALVADGLSNREISERLFISISTVKGHNRNIFDKLQVKRRTEAVARARDLRLIE